MTEAEWLACGNLSQMLKFLQGEIEPPIQEPDPRLRSIGRHGSLLAGAGELVSPEKLVRFARECCKRWWDVPLDVQSRNLIAIYERFLDGQETWEEYRSVCLSAFEASKTGQPMLVSGFHALNWLPTPEGVSSLTQHLVWVIACYTHREQIEQMQLTASEDDLFAWGFFGYGFPEFNETANSIFTTLPPLLREVMGNPFRPVTLDRNWLTSTVLALASGIYEEAFERMPILADALQDAGCDNEDILNHCRQHGEHVRGCWAVNLILGKS